MFARYDPRSPAAPRTGLPADLAIGPAGAGDAAALARLTADRSGESFDECVERVARRLQSDFVRDNLVVVARTTGAVVGFGRARLVPAIPGRRDDAPQGWYLLGVIVDPAFRRRGIASELTRARLAWVAERAAEAFYFANSLNLASIDLHRPFGFAEVRRPFAFPDVTFGGGGVGVLFRADLSKAVTPSSRSSSSPG